MSLHFVRGSDPILRAAVVDALVVELLDGEDRAFALEELTVPSGAGDADGGAGAGPAAGAEGRAAVVAAVVLAAGTPPFMGARRVVVLHDVGAVTAADAGPLLAALDDLLPTTALVLVAGGGTVPPALTKRLKELGADERAPESEKTVDVLARSAREAGIALEADAARALVAHVGEDAGRVGAIVDVLVAAHGEHATVDVSGVAPYLGAVGTVPAYQLTNAVDAGDAATALTVLHRLLTVSSAQQPKPMHPLQVMGMLHNHYRRMLRLDDPAVRTPGDAVAALGGKVKEYPARKALDRARALGPDGIRRSFELLVAADLDLKGARAVPDAAVLEVLVARLAALGGGRRNVRTRSGSTRR